jgi:hypothetical protein
MGGAASDTSPGAPTLPQGHLSRLACQGLPPPVDRVRGLAPSPTPIAGRGPSTLRYTPMLPSNWMVSTTQLPWPRRSLAETPGSLSALIPAEEETRCLDFHSPVSRRSKSNQDDVSQVVNDAPYASPARERAVMNKLQSQHLICIPEYPANRLLGIAEPVQNGVFFR